jgi:2-polyprenyl-3-methyl-5-hydroxy-6-metoxy-1,4-benzoquinol methylase
MRISKLPEKLENLAWQIRPHLPFTSLNTVWRSLDKNGGNILDIGCGEGRPISFINRHRDFCAVGVDIFEPCLKQCQESNIYWALIRADVTKLPFKAKSFDIVLAMEVLEHLEKEAGQELLKAMEKIARKQIIISTPVGRYYQDALGGNPHQEHKAFWHPAELRDLGYKVRGHGLRALFGGEGVTQNYMPGLLRPLGNILWVCAGPFVHFFPELAGDMVGVKNLRN